MTAEQDLNERYIPDLKLDLIEYSKDNPRKFIDEAALAELAESIKQHGVVQAIVVRPHPKKKGSYELVAGERRHRASVKAKQDTIPAVIRHYDDRQAAEVRQIENLQRADVHPMDEAHGFVKLVEVFGYTVESIAQKISKTPGYVARRMELVKLIKPLQDAFWQGTLPIGHAEYLCKLTAEIQVSLHKAKWGGLWERDRERCESLRHVRASVERSFFMDLDKAPWKKDVEGPGSCPACRVCPYRSGNKPLLFPELEKQPNMCTHRPCFDLKMESYIEEQVEENPALLLASTDYNGKKEPGVLSAGTYTKLDEKKDKCEFEEKAIFKDGGARGLTVRICKNKQCKKHGDRIFGGSGGVRRGPNDDTAKRDRNIRIENQARAAMFASLFNAKLKKSDITVEQLRQAAAWSWGRAYERNTIAKAIGWERSKSKYSSNYDHAMTAFVDKASAEDLHKFIMLMVINHSVKCGFDGTKSPQAAAELAESWNVDAMKVHQDTRKALEAKFKAREKKAVKK